MKTELIPIPNLSLQDQLLLDAILIRLEGNNLKFNFKSGYLKEVEVLDFMESEYYRNHADISDFFRI